MRQYIIILGALFIFSCKQYNRNQSHKQIPASSIDSGEVLAKQYCQSCHAFPEPSMLDVKSWEQGVLPNMGPRLGIFNFKWNAYPSMRRDRNLPAGYYPSRPLLTPDEWQHIMDYYLAMAPDAMPAQQRPFAIKNDLSLFRISSPARSNGQPDHLLYTGGYEPLTAQSFCKVIFSAGLWFVMTGTFNRLIPFPSSGPVIDIDLHATPRLPPISAS